MTVATDLQRNPWLDVCRGLAILLVLLSHGRVFLRGEFPWTELLRFGGFLGVELFFVLSGFLIGGILIRQARSGTPHWLRVFYLRRWFRTLPNYYLFVLINIGLVTLAIRPGDLSVVWQYLVFVQNLFWPHPLFFPEAWSLAVEEMFYLLFPALFLGLGRRLGLDSDRAILVTACGVLVASLLARVAVATGTEAWDEAIRKVAFLRFDTLMFGVLLAWLHAHGSPLLARRGWVWGAVALFVAAGGYFAVTPDPVLNQSLFAKTLYLSLASIGCAGLVIVGTGWRLPSLLAGPANLLARISYSAYLVNIPVALTLVWLAEKGDNAALSPLATWSVFMAATLVISYVVYRWYERFFNALRDRWFPA
ncbi:MAG: acyltransferase family protein [Pseudomonadota bacterium]